VDGVDAGANAAYFADFLSGALDLPINVQELSTDSSIVQALNYRDSYVDANGVSIWANDLPANVSALISYYRDQTWDVCALSLLPSCSSDGVVQTDSQSIEAPLRNHPIPGALDLPPNSYLSTDSSISTDANCLWNSLETLHLLPCLADSHRSADQPPANILHSAIIPTIQGEFTQINIQTFEANGPEYTGPVSLTLAGPNSTSTAIATPQPPIMGPWRQSQLLSLISLWQKSRVQKIHPSGAKALLILLHLWHD
jgi:hypothetical protein